MRPEEVQDLYDRAYVSAYDEKFLESPLTAGDTKFELELIGSLLTPTTRWLDVGCGTGYFLSRFPDIARTGIDISPAMLERAALANPGVEFRQHDFRDPIPEWTDQFGLVSCMWYAYSYLDTFAELSGLIANLAAWTAPTGHCLVPIADPNGLTGVGIPYRAPTPWAGEVTVSGIIWSFSDNDGAKRHHDLLAPTIEFMREQFTAHFAQVEVRDYSPSDLVAGRGPALIASHKRVPRRRPRWLTRLRSAFSGSRSA